MANRERLEQARINARKLQVVGPQRAGVAPIVDRPMDERGHHQSWKYTDRFPLIILFQGKDVTTRRKSPKRRK